MRNIIVTVSLITAIAFLAISALSSTQIFTQILSSGEEIRSELWILIILTFLGGVVMIGIAWAIVELSDRRDSFASQPLHHTNRQPYDDDDDV
jgi:Kef-type K+ transport system membrane component KefB